MKNRHTEYMPAPLRLATDATPLTDAQELQAQIVATQAMLTELFSMAHALFPSNAEADLAQKRAIAGQLRGSCSDAVKRIALRSMEIQIETMGRGIEATKSRAAAGA